MDILGSIINDLKMIHFNMWYRKHACIAPSPTEDVLGKVRDNRKYPKQLYWERGVFTEMVGDDERRERLGRYYLDYHAVKELEKVLGQTVERGYLTVSVSNIYSTITINLPGVILPKGYDLRTKHGIDSLSGRFIPLYREAQGSLLL